ncbi:pilin [Patescibacteria group bacterium]|nr:pilin [Patescibacteria group bacterium]
MKKLILPFFLFVFLLLFPVNKSFAANCLPGQLSEGQTGCTIGNTPGLQGNCCSGLICQTALGINQCVNPDGTTPPTTSTTKPSVVFCTKNGNSCNTNEDCCSLVCSVDTNNPVQNQKKCFEVEPTWPAAKCQAPNEVCEKDINCCYGSCIEQGGAKICMEDAPSSNNPPPCSEWQDGKCIKIATGLGIDIPTDVEGIVKTFFGIILSIAGATATLLFIYAGYKIMAARGNPEKFQEAKDRFTSTILGLLFIILSLVILQIIGVDLLQIPGFK